MNAIFEPRYIKLPPSLINYYSGISCRIKTEVGRECSYYVGIEHKKL